MFAQNTLTIYFKKMLFLIQKICNINLKEVFTTQNAFTSMKEL